MKKLSISLNHLIVFMTLFVTYLCVGCSNSTDKEIETNTGTGVVLVLNKSYYEVKLPNGKSLYFTQLDEDGDISGLATEEDSVEVATGYGTGFLISDKGEIATNSHVVSNTASDKDVTKSVANIFSALKEVIAESYNEYEETYNKTLRLYNHALVSDDYSYEDCLQLSALADALKEKMNEYVETYSNLSELRAQDSEIIYHNEVSIAYNDTHVTDYSDFLPCVVLKTDPDHDVAILQLKDKKTPADRYVFTIPEDDPLETYTIMDQVTSKISDDKNSKLFMHSFNLGPQLALTKEGIKAQFNNGSISQKTADRIMYSIPTLPGSSGSPVVNHKGELVAINYAGLQGTQNFNYGIRIKHLRSLRNS